MKVAFLDSDGVTGEATDDGTTYSYSYSGTDTAITAVLQDAETWTGVEAESVDAVVTDPPDNTVGESFDGRPTPLERGHRLIRELRSHVQLVERVE